MWRTSLALFLRQITACFSLLPDLDDKILLLLISHTLVTGFGEKKLVLIWKLSLCWLDFIILENAMLEAGGEKSSLVYPVCEPCELQ